jgi:hypothetical protein
MKAVIHISGGAVQGIYVDNKKLNVIVMDHDCEYGDDHVQEFLDDEGDYYQAVPINDVVVDKKHVDSIFSTAVL